MTGRKAAGHLFWHRGDLSSADRERNLGQKGCVVWLTGLSGSGKSTVARALESLLVRAGRNAFVLDGDNIRMGLNKDARLLRTTGGYDERAARRFGLGFSPADRTENIRRIGEVAKLLMEANVIAVTAFISPSRADRRAVRSLLPKGRFFEIFLSAPLAACEARDPKGLYRRARAGEIPDFTGVSAPYERPFRPELILETHRETPDVSARKILSLLRRSGIVPRA